MRQLVETVSDRFKVSQDLTAFCLLASISACAYKRYVIKVDRRMINLNLHAMIVSDERWDNVLKIFTNPLLDFQKSYNHYHTEAIQQGATKIDLFTENLLGINYKGQQALGASLFAVKKQQLEQLLTVGLNPAPYLYCQARIENVRHKPTRPVEYANYARLCNRLLVMANDEPHELTLSPESYEILATYRHTIRQQLFSGGSMADMQDWGGNLVEQVIRLAGLLHIVNGLGKHTMVVGALTMQSVVLLGDWLVSHYRKCVIERIADVAEIVDNARYLARRLAMSGNDEFMCTWDVKRLTHKNWSLEKVTETLLVLEDMGHVGEFILPAGKTYFGRERPHKIWQKC